MLAVLDLYKPEVLDAWYKLYGLGDPSGYFELMGEAAGGDRQELLAGMALNVFRLNGQFLDVAEGLARPVGLTAARWQVLGAVLRAPLRWRASRARWASPARACSASPTSWSRTGMAEYLPNPAHRRAKLVAPTDAG